MPLWRGVIVAGALVAAACSAADDRTLPTVTPSTVASGETTTSLEPIDPAPSADDIAPPPQLIGELQVEVVATHPHDPAAFTQGLEVTEDGRLLESTGLYGQSDRRLVDIETGAVLEIVETNSAVFGEGVTIVGDELIQLTWRARRYVRADLDTLAETGSGIYDGEGWGLCYDGSQLVMSDGTSTLTFRNPETFEPTGTVEVTLNGEPLININELECVNGQVVANVWLTDFIVVIDPATGEVVGTLDGSALRPADLPVENSSFALNGIAHDPTTGRFFLTGKLWPVLYEVELSSPAS